MFRNFYIRLADGTETDALSDGSDSCAFYVSSVLTLFGKQTGIHGTVKSTIEDLRHCDWQEKTDTEGLQPGDVIVWEAIEIHKAWFEHIGFYLGNGRAVSTSWTEKRVVDHDTHFDGRRAIKQIFRHLDWQ